MDRTLSLRYVALLLPLGTVSLAGCGWSVDCSSVATPSARSSASIANGVAAPRRLQVSGDIKSLDAPVGDARVATATMIHHDLNGSAGPELSMPVLPVHESVWDAGLQQNAEAAAPERLEQAETAETDPFVEEAVVAAVEEAAPSYAEQVTLPWAEETIETTELQAAMSQADALVRRGFNLAARGAIFSARAQFEAGLRLLAESLDMATGVDHHCKSLAAGLTALKECDDFQQRSLDQPLDVAAIVQAHRTPILKHDQLQGLSSSAASQRYFSYAQEQLAAAAGGKAAGSLALYGLGRSSSAIDPTKAHTAHANARAITYLQAALLVDAKNHLAANELGVVLARVGRYEHARAMLEQSLAASPRAETWHNLSVVYSRLGEIDLAAKARIHSTSLAGNRSVHSPGVKWVDPGTFASLSPSGVGPTPAVVNSTPTAVKSSVKKSAWRWPFSKSSTRR